MSSGAALVVKAVRVRLDWQFLPRFPDGPNGVSGRNTLEAKARQRSQ